MPENKFNQAILPVMFGFFIMGFVDIVGVATNYVKADFTGMNDNAGELGHMRLAEYGPVGYGKA